jgi:excisionase family DNA binding protein
MPKKPVAEGSVRLHPILVPEELFVELMARQNEVLDLREAAAFLKSSDEDVLRLVKEQGLPARQVGDGWRFLKSAVCEWLRTGSLPRPLGNEAMLAFAGAWKDDPNLEDMVEEIYRKRGRPITEDGSYRLFHGLEREKGEK